MSEQINLYQAEFRKQKQRFSATTMLLSMGIVVAAMVLFFALQTWQLHHLQGQLQGLGAQHTDISAKFAALKAKTVERHPNPQLEAEVRKLEAMLALREQLQTLLSRDVFAMGEGYSNYFFAFSRQHIPGMWLTGITITGAGQDLALKGQTTAPELVPQYLGKLSVEAPLAGTEFELFKMNRLPPTEKGPPTIEFMVATMAPP